MTKEGEITDRRTIRKEQILLTSQVVHLLWMIAQFRKPADFDPELHNIVTADWIADDMLREAIQEKYPDLVNFDKDARSKERKFLKNYRPKSNDSNDNNLPLPATA